MTEFIEKLIQNEEMILSLTSNSTVKLSAKARLKAFKTLNGEGDVVKFILAHALSGKGQAMLELLKSESLTSYYEIYLKYSNTVNTQDCISFQNLVEGKQYTSLEVCSLADCFNQMKGMYLGRDEFGLVNSCILKSTINGKSKFKDAHYYNDSWLDDEHTVLDYYLQTEDTVNTFEFKKPENNCIFSGLVTGRPIPIYLFTRDEDAVIGSAFEYCGVFYANSISKDCTRFVLVKAPLFNQVKYRDERFSFLDTYASGNIDLLVQSRKQLQMEKLPRMNHGKRTIDAQLLGDNYLDPDYLEYMKLFRQIQKIGIREVIEFEKAKLNQIDMSLANKVHEIHDPSKGYSLVSFDCKGKETYIDVKTTTTDNGLDPFDLSENEYMARCHLREQYKIYRVFNVHSQTPKAYILGDKETERVDEYHRSWLLQIN